MKEHALPQDVTGYRFHIIGNMTLKQFAEVAVGCVVGFLIYTTNLPVFIKWPLIMIAAGIGAMAAFVPFEERPLDQWIVAFFQALYRPTQFYWKRTSKIPEPFLYESKKELHSLIKEVDLSPARRQRVKEYLHSIPETQETDQMEQYSQQRLSEVMSIFDHSSSVAVVTAAPQAVTASQTMSVPQAAPIVETTDFTPPPEEMGVATVQLKRENKDVAAAAQGVNLSGLQKDSARKVEIKQDIIPSSAEISSIFTATSSVIDYKTNDASPAAPSASARPQATVVSVPETQSIQIAQRTLSDKKDIYEDPTQTGVYVNPESIPHNVFTQPTSQAVENANLPFPTKPTDPNKVVGMVIDAQNTPLTNAIVEVLTPEGFPARAVKTNMLGQFFITTPLSNGTYTLATEKEGYQFSPQQLIISGKILDPIEVRSV
jgi:hypothetical protein